MNVNGGCSNDAVGPVQGQASLNANGGFIAFGDWDTMTSSWNYQTASSNPVTPLALMNTTPIPRNARVLPISGFGGPVILILSLRSTYTSCGGIGGGVLIQNASVTMQ